MADEICPGCGAPITPGEWIACVPVQRDGLRAHLACLERGLPDPPPPASGLLGYHLARRTMSAALLRPGARFVALAGDSVILAVWTDETEAQIATLVNAGLGNSHRHYSVASARAAAGAALPPPAQLPFIMGRARL